MTASDSSESVSEGLRSGASGAAGRIARFVLAAVALAASVLAFPAAIPVVIAFWLAWYTLQSARGQAGWLPLATCLAILLAKRVAWPPSLAIVLAGMLLAIAVDRRGRRPASGLGLRLKLAMPALLWLGWCGVAWDWRRDSHANHRVSAWDQRPIVCIGDSLTSYPPQRGYPKILGQMVNAPVVNLGEPGVTSSEALKRLPELTAAGPQAVVIELGGHDYLKDPSWLPVDSRAEVKRNLEQFIAAARRVDAEVILVEIPRGFVVDPFAGLERELAREHDLELISDGAIRNLVLWSPACPPGLWTDGPYLSDDGLHPNAHGDRYLATVVAQTLARLYGPQILRRAE